MRACSANSGASGERAAPTDGLVAAHAGQPAFAFDAESFAPARAWIAGLRTCDVVVIDGVSQLEAAGGGHHDAIRLALASEVLVLLCVRADQQDLVKARCGLDEPVASSAPRAEASVVDALVDSILRGVIRA